MTIHLTESAYTRLVTENETQRQVIEGQRAEIVRLSMKVYEIQKICGDRTSPRITIDGRAISHA